MLNGRVHLPQYFAPRVPPKVRGDCLPGGRNEARPCTWNRCKYYLAAPSSESCVLDVADKDGVTLEEVADIMGITRERVRQIELIVMRKLRKRTDLRFLMKYLDEEIR